MVFEWKLQGKFKVDAQTAGEELHRIMNTRQSLTPAHIVDESRNADAVLHECFEWNDEIAAERYRENQASEIVRNIVAVSINGEETAEPVRAFVSIESDYKPIDVVIRTPDYQAEMLRKALSELISFQRKYSALSQLHEIFKSIEKITKAS